LGTGAITQDGASAVSNGSTGGSSIDIHTEVIGTDVAIVTVDFGHGLTFFGAWVAIRLPT